METKNEKCQISLIPTIKNSWSRDEVVEIIRKYEDDTNYYGRDSYYKDIDIAGEWIKENL